MIDPQIVGRMIDLLTTYNCCIKAEHRGYYANKDCRPKARFGPDVKYVSLTGLIQTAISQTYGPYYPANHLIFLTSIEKALHFLAGTDYWLEESDNLTNEAVLKMLHLVKKEKGRIYEHHPKIDE